MKRSGIAWAVVVTLGSFLWPATSGSSGIAASPVTQAFSEPGAGYGFLSAAILSAHQSIDLSMYALQDLRIETNLVHMAQSGVRVRVLLNAAYSGRSDNAVAASVLSQGGVQVNWAPSGQIFHAKYLVIDRSRVYIGTANLVNSDYTTTRDFWVLDQVPSDAAAVEATFNGDIAGAGVAPQRRGGLVWSPGSSGALATLIGSARHTLLIENEEMSDPLIERSLDAAAARGVRVTLVMTKSSLYLDVLRNLSQHGVRVYVLQAPHLYIHSKVICADCSAMSGTAFVGSENFSTSSLDDNRELGVITRTPVAINVVRRAILADAATGGRLGP
jgi:cardiolipin synthase A/B